jgi:hypothetical protein
MALIDDLKEQRAEAVKVRDEHFEEAIRCNLSGSKWQYHIDDLDRAIAALTPTPDFEAEKETAREQLEREPEIPEGFTKWEGCEWTGLPSDMVQVIFHDEPTPYFPTSAENLEPLWAWDRCSPDAQRIIAYRIIKASPAPDPDEQDDASEFISDLTGDPAIEPEAGLHGEPTDLQGDTVPELQQAFDEIFGAQEERPAINEQMQDERELPITDAIQEVEAATRRQLNSEGYAPVTNPEADAIARAHDYYSPEKVAERNRFDPFAMFKREDA